MFVRSAVLGALWHLFFATAYSASPSAFTYRDEPQVSKVIEGELARTLLPAEDYIHWLLRAVHAPQAERKILNQKFSDFQAVLINRIGDAEIEWALREAYVQLLGSSTARFGQALLETHTAFELEVVFAPKMVVVDTLQWSSRIPELKKTAAGMMTLLGLFLEKYARNHAVTCAGSSVATPECAVAGIRSLVRNHHFITAVEVLAKLAAEQNDFSLRDLAERALIESALESDGGTHRSLIVDQARQLLELTCALELTREELSSRPTAK